jgi:hypothetical protein
MGSDLIPHGLTGLQLGTRRLSREMSLAQRPGRIAVARIEAAAFAAHTAMHHAGMLSATEARLIQQAPLGEARYKAIADAFAGYACHEISLLANRR